MFVEEQGRCTGGNQDGCGRRGLQPGSGRRMLINSPRNPMESTKTKQTTKGRGKTEMKRRRPVQTEMVGRMPRWPEMLALWRLYDPSLQRGEGCGRDWMSLQRSDYAARQRGRQFTHVIGKVPNWLVSSSSKCAGLNQVKTFEGGLCPFLYGHPCRPYRSHHEFYSYRKCILPMTMWTWRGPRASQETPALEDSLTVASLERVEDPAKSCPRSWPLRSTKWWSCLVLSNQMCNNFLYNNRKPTQERIKVIEEI